MKALNLDKLDAFMEIEYDSEIYNAYTKNDINDKAINAIPLDKIKKAREQIIDEKEFAYADFERYKEEVLLIEPDELPDDDFRYGMERCLEILNKLIESEENE